MVEIAAAMPLLPRLTQQPGMIHSSIMNPKPNTKDSIIEAAIQVLASRPSASLSEVAESAGVKRVTLHRLVGTREELLKEIAIQSLEEMDQACTHAAEGAKTAIAALRAIVAALVPVGDRCHFLWSQDWVWEEPRVAKKIAKQNMELFALLNLAKAEGSISPDIPNAWISAAIDAVVFAALTTSRAGDIAVNDSAALAVRTLFNGIETNSGKRSGKK